MRSTSRSTSSAMVLLYLTVVAVLCVELVAAAPSRPSLRSTWSKQNRVRRHSGASLTKRQFGPFGPFGPPDNSTGPRTTRFPACQVDAPPVKAPKDNVWAPLTDLESAAVLGWLYHQPELNLTRGGVHGFPFGGGGFGNGTDLPHNGTYPFGTFPPFNGTLPPFNGSFPPFGPPNSTHGPFMPNFTLHPPSRRWENTIELIELQAPNKSDVLAYLDGSGPAPKRYVHVLISNLTSENPSFQDLLVGPLPIDNGTTKWQPLEYPYTRKTQGRVRNLEADNNFLYAQWVFPIGKSIENITLDLWNATASGEATDSLFPLGIDPLWQDEDGRVHTWHQYARQSTDLFDTGTLLPQGLYFKLDTTGRDPDKWKFEGWFYNDVFYETTEEFQKAYWSPGFEKVRGGVDGVWAYTDRQGDALPLDDMIPPVPAAQPGATPRFRVDVAKQYIEWMGFSFYLGFSRDTGLSLHDIRYDGERILYELAFQEALAHYAGNDPFLSSIAYLDSYYGFGPFTFELVPGFDCPQYATYLNSSYYTSETTHTHPNSICLFEFDESNALQRHTSSGYVSITKNTQFVVRAVATVGNYDYTFSYTFGLDGSIGFDVRASGYILSGFGFGDDEYGFKIHDALSGAMHDHVANFKADFDIKGTKNSVQLVSNVPISKTYPWSGGQVRNTMKLERKFISNENDAKLDWDANAQGQLLVVNTDAKTPFGEHRGYRIAPASVGAHLTVRNSSSLVNTARWAEHDVHVTVRKDTEPRSSHNRQNQDVHNPPIDFSKFSDGESLNQTDLVVWVNLAMHHVPHTGDLPNTVTTEAQASVKFVPSNYFDGDVSRRTRSAVRVDYFAGYVSSVETFDRAQVCEADLWRYGGDVVVRKYPYDPNPYMEGPDAIP